MGVMDGIGSGIWAFTGMTAATSTVAEMTVSHPTKFNRFNSKVPINHRHIRPAAQTMAQ